MVKYGVERTRTGCAVAGNGIVARAGADGKGECALVRHSGVKREQVRFMRQYIENGVFVVGMEISSIYPRKRLKLAFMAEVEGDAGQIVVLFDGIGSNGAPEARCGVACAEVDAAASNLGAGKIER